MVNVCVQHAPCDAMVNVVISYFNYLGLEACGYKWQVSHIIHKCIIQKVSGKNKLLGYLRSILSLLSTLSSTNPLD
jgi:hypothetical protein